MGLVSHGRLVHHGNTESARCSACERILAKVQRCEAQVDRGGQGSRHGHKLTLLLTDLSLPLCQAWLLTPCLYRLKNVSMSTPIEQTQLRAGLLACC